MHFKSIDSLPVLSQDWHVHSRWSDGKNTIDENIWSAQERGIRLLGCVDHVRADTDYLPGFIRDVERARSAAGVVLLCGVEAKMLNVNGDMDVPDLPVGVDVLMVADHQLPTASGPLSPEDARAGISRGEFHAANLARDLVNATSAAIERWADSRVALVLAHWGSILPKSGIPDSALAAADLDRLAALCAATGGRVEISERWKCPSPVFLDACLRSGVRIVASTDSHTSRSIGAYVHVRATLQQLGIV